jgi:nitrate/nitrite-specific signal transduction histidine kinase
MSITTTEVSLQAGPFDAVGAPFGGSGLPVTAPGGVSPGTEYHVRRLTILREITLAVTSTLDLHAVLASLLEKIDQLLPYAASTVHLFDKHGKLNPVTSRNIRIEDWKAGYGAGFLKEILERKEPVMSLDVDTDRRSRGPAFFRKYRLVSFLAIPLIVKEKIIGVLSFYTKTRYRFSTDEIEFLTTLAGQASIAIHNSQLYEQTRKQRAANAKLLKAYENQVRQVKAANQSLSALHSISSIASRSLDIDAVLKEVIQEITKIFNFTSTRIFLLDRSTNELLLRASFETRPEFYISNNAFQIGQGLIGRVAKTRRPILFEDVSRDPRYPKLSHSKLNLKAGLKFFAVFPIMTRSTTVGCMNFSGQEPRQLSRNEVRLIKSMIGHIAAAVETATLFKATEKKVEELSVLYRLARVLNSSLNFETLLRRIMNEVVTIFKFDEGRIYVYDDARKHLKILADRRFPRGTLLKIQGTIREVIEKRHPLFFDDFRNDANYLKWSKRRVALKEGFRSGFFLPIQAKGNVLGMFSFLSREVHRFSVNERRLIDTIANHLGTAVENSQLYEAMERSRQQLQGLAERMQLAREEERARLARQLHNEFGQDLAALKMAIDIISTDAPSDPELKEQSKNQAFDLIDIMVKSVRRLGRNLRPDILDDLDLTAALERHAQEFEERTGVKCRIKSTVKHHSLDKPRAIALLRIFQEALSNVQRHSGADRVDIEWTQRRTGVSLKIQDNGKGIKPKALRRTESSGIIAMRERALLCGGTLDVFGERGSGTTVRAYIPSRSLKAKRK